MKSTIQIGLAALAMVLMTIGEVSARGGRGGAEAEWRTQHGRRWLPGGNESPQSVDQSVSLDEPALPLDESTVPIHFFTPERDFIASVDWCDWWCTAVDRCHRRDATVDRCHWWSSTEHGCDWWRSSVNGAIGALARQPVRSAAVVHRPDS